MKIEHASLDKIHPDPANVRRHPERNLDAIKASLARFGQQKPIIVDAAGIIRAGNGTYEAAKALGWESIAVVQTALQGSEATAYAIADNRTAELAEWDDAALAETLRSLQSEDFDLGAVGYTDDEVDALIGRLADDIAPPEDFAAYDESIATDYTCPKCGYRWSGKVGEAALSGADDAGDRGD
jgi:ParB-like chromosome segregation protein Spo0J